MNELSDQINCDKYGNLTERPQLKSMGETIDQLTKERDDLQNLYRNAYTLSQSCEKELNVVARERDELKELVSSLRRDLCNPPPDVQEKVIQMLNLVHVDAVAKVEKERDELALNLNGCEYAMIELRRCCGMDMNKTDLREVKLYIDTLRTRTETAEACCAEMRIVLDAYLRSPNRINPVSVDAVMHALSTDCGKPILDHVKRLEELIKEVLAWHADRNSGDYNMCDEGPCMWCVNAKQALEDAQ